MKKKLDPVMSLMVLFAMFISLTSCASHVMSSRQKADLEAWQNDTEYDPVTGKSYHRGTPRPVQDVLFDQYIQERIEE